MTRAVKVKHVRLTTFSHATEDPRKVIEALLNVLPKQLRPSVKILENTLKGHYGNEIKVFNVELHNDDAYNTFKYIVCSMSSSDINALLISLNSRIVNKSHLHIRLDKQEAYLGVITLRDGSDVIKLSITIEGCKALDDVKFFINELMKECR